MRQVNIYVNISCPPHYVNSIRMISEGSCDTEDCCNYAENYMIKLHLNKY